MPESIKLNGYRTNDEPLRPFPEEKFPIQINYSTDLAESETIASAAITVTDITTGLDVTDEIISGIPVYGDATVTQEITGWTSEHSYVVACYATTSESRVYGVEIRIDCMKTSKVYPQS